MTDHVHVWSDSPDMRRAVAVLEATFLAFHASHGITVREYLDEVNANLQRKGREVCEQCTFHLFGRLTCLAIETKEVRGVSRVSGGG